MSELINRLLREIASIKFLDDREALNDWLDNTIHVLNAFPLSRDNGILESTRSTLVDVLLHCQAEIGNIFNRETVFKNRLRLLKVQMNAIERELIVYYAQLK